MAEGNNKPTTPPAAAAAPPPPPACASAVPPPAATPSSLSAAPPLPAAKTHKRDLFDVVLKVDSMVSGETMVTIEPPKTGKRVPVDICCVVDVSGSMSTEATLKNAKGATESHGLSVLDVAKHSVRTIIQMLGPNDRLSLVTYSTDASVVLGLCDMTADGKKKAEAEVKRMHTQNQTNIWAGLMKGLKDLQGKHVKGKRRHQHILLLTDGQPNISPPKGEVAMLQKFQEENPEMKCVVHTFGFGYNLNTILLQKLAETGGGSYSFIPDASLVGTVFVNATSNIMVTQGCHAQLRLTPLNGAKFVDGPLLSGLPKGLHTAHDKGAVVVDVGTVHFGQRNQVLFNMHFGSKDTTAPHLKAELVYAPAIRAKDNGCRRVATEASGRVSDLEITAQVARYLTVDCIFAVTKQMKAGDMAAAGKTLAAAVKHIRALPHDVAHKDPRVADACKDLLGQVKEAISRKDFFNRWGKHYLPSLAQAHLQQICNNFKDPGVQHYGGKDFTDQRDIADEIFCEMPPPKPSPKPIQRSNITGLPVPAAKSKKTYVWSMKPFYNRGGGCFHGDCRISMAGGGTKPMRELQRGDKILTGAGIASTVYCVTRTVAPGNTMALVRLPNAPRLLATPYHPVKVGGKWVFPSDVGRLVTVSCDAVFNLLLADGASMVIEGVECVTLGHGMKGSVVGHTYYGNRQAVTKDLQRMPGWERGVVDLTPKDLIRDQATKTVVAIRKHAIKEPQCQRHALLGARAIAAN